MLCDTVFCFKQKTAYEMRISDWSSDVCSSDLALPTMKAVLEGKIQGVQKINAGDSKFEAEMLVNFVIAVVSGILLVLAVLVLLYKIGRASCRERVCQYV